MVRVNRKMWERIKYSPMAPKTKPDPAMVAWLKELRQAAKLEEKLKAIEKMRKQAPQHNELPTKKPKGNKRKVR